MAEATKGGFDPDKLAAALLAAAETYTPETTTEKEKLAEPKVVEAVKAMKRKGMTSAAITGVLKANGVTLSAGTFNKYWRDITKEAKGGSDGKSERKSKATAPRASAEAPKDSKATAPATGEATGSGSTGKPADETGSAKPTEAAKATGGGASKKPTMAANIDPNEL